MNNKKESLSAHLPKLILAVSMIVCIGALFGAVGYLASRSQQIVIPIVNPVVEKEITITTDKTEYETGEFVKIVITNNQNVSIYTSPYDAFPLIYSINKFVDNKWQCVSQNCQCEFNCIDGVLMSCPRYSPPSPYFREFKGPFLGEWKQTECVSNKNQACGTKSYTAVADGQVGVGKYKVEFCYWNKEDIDLKKEVDFAPQDKKVCMEKEFTIKEKSAVDPRCGQKAKISETCSAVGFEFNLNEEKCVVVNGAGCIDKLPFGTLEECQKVCEN